MTVHLWGGSVGPVLWNSKIATALAICQISKFLIDFMNLVTYNWLLQHQYNMPMYPRYDETGQKYTFDAKVDFQIELKLISARSLISQEILLGQYQNGRYPAPK